MENNLQNQQKQNALVRNDTFKAAIVKQQETYTNMIAKSFADMDLNLDNYKKICVINCVQKMNEMLTNQGLKFSDMDQGTINQILTRTAMLELNIASSPRECYLQFRNSKVNNEWKKTFEFGIEGDGNDKILRKYGVNVKDVKGPFLVRKDDEFTYPFFDGEEMRPLTWHPVSYYKQPIKVFYIITKNDCTKEFLVSEREEVVHNLQAHIKNNMLKVDDKTKNEVLKKISTMTLDAILDDESLRAYISPAWFDAQSRDAMIERKMKNNATKKYPKDFKSAFVEESYESTFDDYDQYREDKAKQSTVDFTKPEKVEKSVDDSNLKAISTTNPQAEAVIHQTGIIPEDTEETQVLVESKSSDDDNPF